MGGGHEFFHKEKNGDAWSPKRPIKEKTDPTGQTDIPGGWETLPKNLYETGESTNQLVVGEDPKWEEKGKSSPSWVQLFPIQEVPGKGPLLDKKGLLLWNTPASVATDWKTVAACYDNAHIRCETCLHASPIGYQQRLKPGLPVVIPNVLESLFQNLKATWFCGGIVLFQEESDGQIKRFAILVLQHVGTSIKGLYMLPEVALYISDGETVTTHQFPIDTKTGFTLDWWAWLGLTLHKGEESLVIWPQYHVETIPKDEQTAKGNGWVLPEKPLGTTLDFDKAKLGLGCFHLASPPLVESYGARFSCFAQQTYLLKCSP